jgi:hypothetical protein
VGKPIDWQIRRIFSVDDQQNGRSGEYSLWTTNIIADQESILCGRPIEWQIRRIFSVDDQ